MDIYVINGAKEYVNMFFTKNIFCIFLFFIKNTYL